jgi:hypothetical protein
MRCSQPLAVANHRFQFHKPGQLFIRTTKRFPSPQCASAIQIVHPLESIAETQPQLQPALLRLSAIISQYFIYGIYRGLGLGVKDASRTRKAFFWVKPLAAMPRIALRAARARMINRNFFSRLAET